MVVPPSPQDPLDLVTKEMLAKRLRKSVRGLNKMIARGDLPRPFKIGRTAYWRAIALAAYFALLESGGL